jgi:hypothetical protein
LKYVIFVLLISCSSCLLAKDDSTNSTEVKRPTDNVIWEYQRRSNRSLGPLASSDEICALIDHPAFRDDFRYESQMYGTSGPFKDSTRRGREVWLTEEYVRNQLHYASLENGTRKRSNVSKQVLPYGRIVLEKCLRSDAYSKAQKDRFVNKLFSIVDRRSKIIERIILESCLESDVCVNESARFIALVTIEGQLIISSWLDRLVEKQDEYFAKERSFFEGLNKRQQFLLSCYDKLWVKSNFPDYESLANAWGITYLKPWLANVYVPCSEAARDIGGSFPRNHTELHEGLRTKIDRIQRVAGSVHNYITFANDVLLAEEREKEQIEATARTKRELVKIRKASSGYAYKLEIECRYGQNFDLEPCLVNSEFKIVTQKATRSVTLFNLGEYGQYVNGSLFINVPDKFIVVAQNSDSVRTLSLKLYDKDGALLQTVEAGQYSIAQIERP